MVLTTAHQQKESNTMLDLEYVHLHVNKVLALLNKVRLRTRASISADAVPVAFRQTTIDFTLRVSSSILIPFDLDTLAPLCFYHSYR